MASPKLYGPLTRLQACPPTFGAAAAILVSPAFAAKHGLDARVEIVAQSMTTDTETSFEPSMMKVIGYDMATEAARQEIGRAYVCTPVTNSHLLCRLLLQK